MEKEFIPYEQSLDLKELGFDERCLSFWTNNPKYKGNNIQLCITDGIDGYPPNSISFKQDFLIEGEVLAPLYQQAFKWFREKYGLIGWIEGKQMYGYRIESIIPTDDQLNAYPFRKYEEAELECLKKLIEIVNG